eukprot:scaffold426_cov319-Pavlova_lutheri.AAC.11
MAMPTRRLTLGLTYPLAGVSSLPIGQDWVPRGGESNRAHPTDPPFSFPFRTRRRGPIEPELDPVCPDGEGRGWPRSLRTS